MSKKLIGLLFLFMQTCWAADTYTPETNQLKIPQVRVGDASYFDVIVTVDKVISVNSETSSNISDVYDPITNKLFIPSVNVGSVNYKNVVITVGSVLSATAQVVPNGIKPIPVRPNSTPQIGPKYFWSFDNNFTNTPIVEDVNNDGKDDLIFIPTNYRTNTNSYDADGQKWPTYKFIYYQSNGDGTFTDKTEKAFPGGQWVGMSATRYLYKDFNGDGIKDFMIIDQGYESLPKNPLILPDMDIGYSNPPKVWTDELSNQGAILTWWEGTKSGIFLRHDIVDDSYMAFHHNGDAADIDGDGKMEIIIANASTFQYVTKTAISQYFLNPKPNSSLETGGGYSTRIPDSEIISIGMRPLIPLKFDSSGKYRLAFNMLAKDDSLHPINLPFTEFKMLGAGVSKFADVNGDGKPDLIVGVSTPYPGAPTYNRIYINNGTGYSADNFIKLPIALPMLDPGNHNGAVFIDAADIDGDGLLDVAIGYENPGNGMGNGHFVQIFKQKSLGIFVDETINSIGAYSTSSLVKSVLKGKPGTGAEPSWLKFKDINGDGIPDLVFMTGIVAFDELSAFFLINDGSGKFTPVDSKYFAISNLRKNLNDSPYNDRRYQAVVGDFNGDGVIDSLTLEYDFAGYNTAVPDSLYRSAYMYTQVKFGVKQ